MLLSRTNGSGTALPYTASGSIPSSKVVLPGLRRAASLAGVDPDTLSIRSELMMAGFPVTLEAAVALGFGATSSEQVHAEAVAVAAVAAVPMSDSEACHFLREAVTPFGQAAIVAMVELWAEKPGTWGGARFFSAAPDAVSMSLALPPVPSAKTALEQAFSVG